MITTYDYTLPENNCFIVKHSNKQYNDFVESFIFDSDKNQITINYHNIIIPNEKEIILEIYSNFGILQETKIFLIQDIIDKTKYSVTYQIHKT